MKFQIETILIRRKLNFQKDHLVERNLMLLSVYGKRLQCLHKTYNVYPSN